MMIGRSLADIYPRAATRRPARSVLAVRGLSRPGVLHDIDLDVRDGEILGICGLAGSGRTELLRALLGRRPAAMPSPSMRGATPAEPARRDPPGAWRSCRRTARPTAASCRRASRSTSPSRGLRQLRGGLLSEGGERAAVGGAGRRLNIRMPRPASRIAELSGGNQQKCLIARSLNAGCGILLIDEPTRGVDVGAKREIYQLLARLADRGARGDRHGLVGAAGDPGPERPHPRHARRPHRRGRFERGEATEEALMQCAVERDWPLAGRSMSTASLAGRNGGTAPGTAQDACGDGDPARLGLVWVLLVMCVAAALISPAFLNPFNLINVLRQIALFGIVSIGMTFVILTAGIDLSVGSIVAVTAVVSALLLKAGTPIPLVILAGLAIGAAMGAINGLGITVGRLPPFIMTLGMMVMGRGLAMTIADGHPIPFPNASADFAWLGQGHSGSDCRCPCGSSP